MSPYATGGGGVTFERKVAVNYLAKMLTRSGATELGGGRSIASVSFQQAPDHAVDDLVVRARRANESNPSLVLALAIRREPSLIKSDDKARKLIGTLLSDLRKDLGTDVDHLVGLVVAGPQPHASQLAELSGLARGQSDPEAFFALIQEPNRFDRSLRQRLEHIGALVRLAMQDAADGVAPGAATVSERTWFLLTRLQVLMPRFESPDESDWAVITNDLVEVATGNDLSGAIQLRDRLGALAAEYAPIAGAIDLDLLRRDAHDVLASTTRRHQKAWQLLNGLHERAVDAVRGQVTSSDGDHHEHVDRTATVRELRSLALANSAVIVRGESGVGKSALVIEAATATYEEGNQAQALVLNLRHLPATALEFEQALGAPLKAVLAEMSAPERLLIIDGADAVAERKLEQLGHLVAAARQSNVRIVALTTNDIRKLVHDAVAEHCDGTVVDFEIDALSDAQIDQLVAAFPELSALANNAQARELLRRLVVVDLLIRGGVSGLPLTDGDAMQQIWAGLVRRHEQSDRGTPDARELVILQLAELSVTRADPLPVLATLDAAALAGLRRDGLLQTPTNQPFRIGPEFAHDEVRRYAVARLLLATENPTVKLLAAGMPRWSLGAARLASQLYLGAPDSADNPFRGRFARLEHAFGAVVAAGHGERWADVPSEALLTLADPGLILAEAWDDLATDNKAGLHRLCRLTDQRHLVSGIVRLSVVEPVVRQLLRNGTPWFGDEKLQELVRDWLRAHIAADTPAGSDLRVELCAQLVARCAAADERQRAEKAAVKAARAARTPDKVERDKRMAAQSHMFREIGYPRSRPRRRRELPREVTDKVMVELLALLGPDLSDDGEVLLRQVADESAIDLGPAVEGALAGRALASRAQGFLAKMTAAYYLDEDEDGSGLYEDGVRDHEYHGFGAPHAAWYYGSFMPLLQSDFQGGVHVINRMLNHAARARLRSLASNRYYSGSVSDEDPAEYATELHIAGTARSYVGDPHVYDWYRGTSVGPYPCMSALQALERVCDQLIEIGIAPGKIVAMLLDGCDNLAMVGFVVGLLVRHIGKTNGLLDPYLSEPSIWHLEFGRVVNESSGLKASSDGVAGAERREWSLREVAMELVLRADDGRAEEYRQLAQLLVQRKEQAIRAAAPDASDAEVEQYLVSARGWASGMDRDTYTAQQTEDGQLMIQSTPPEPLLKALESGSADIQRGKEATRLFVEYYINAKNGTAAARSAETLTADLQIAKELIADPPGLSAGGKWDAPASVIAAALKAHLIDGVALPDESLRFAVDTIISIAGAAVQERQFESEASYFEQGADRAAARILPLLLSPGAQRTRALVDGDDGSATYLRVEQAAKALAQALPNEVRVHLARGLDHLWQTSCPSTKPCHHVTALELISESMRDCAFGVWDPETGRRSILQLDDPIGEALSALADDAIYFDRLDAALRALAPTAVADTCVSGEAANLFRDVVNAQRRALLAHERNTDDRGTHALNAARALLTIVENGDPALLFEHLDAFADRSDLLGSFLRALSSAAEESSSRAVTLARLWPEVVYRVLGYTEDHEPFGGRHHGDYARASLIPNPAGEVSYLYRELDETPIVWWDPRALVEVVEAWLPTARGHATCVDHLISFVRVLTPDDQVRVGLPWVSDLALEHVEQVTRRSFSLSNWLVEIRPAILDAASLASWQRLVDALVVAGDSTLAPYSD
ncbi:hypothetical protein CH295_12625 [Rhodococcus sp. 14-2483-1-2]|nr:hypothetical protein CH295_12625 [Rhodococcus sp. 14-2483-1-2]